MTVRQAIELFGSHQRIQVRQKTRDGYRYLIRNLEALFGDSPVEAISSEDIYQIPSHPHRGKDEGERPPPVRPNQSVLQLSRGETSSQIESL